MQEQTPKALKITIITLATVAVVSAGLVLWGMREKATEAPAQVPVQETGEVTDAVEAKKAVGPLEAPTNLPKEDEVVKAQAPEPEPLSVDVQAQINAITARVDRGELTLDEAQEEINKLLGI